MQAIPNYEKLEDRAQKGKELVARFRSLMERSDTDLGLLLNNAGIDFQHTYFPFKFSSVEKYPVIRYFAERGDPLCQSVISHLVNSTQDALKPLRVIEDKLWNSELPEKLATRTLTEKEYNDILKGKSPFTTTMYGRELYLPKKN